MALPGNPPATTTPTAFKTWAQAVVDTLTEHDDSLEDFEAPAASGVAFTPAGTIAATNVQAAIVEVATEAVGSSGVRVEDEGSSVVAAATGINFAGAGVVVTDAGSNEALVTIAGGGADAPGTLLAQTLYSPASNTNIATRSNTAPADADATNLAVTFTAPASGEVYVVLECLGTSSISGQGSYWGLRESTTDLTFKAGGTKQYVTAFNQVIRLRATINLSGVSGGSHTYKWAISSDTGSSNAHNLYAGDVSQGTALMQVFVGI